MTTMSVSRDKQQLIRKDVLKDFSIGYKFTKNTLLLDNNELFHRLDIKMECLSKN